MDQESTNQTLDQGSGFKLPPLGSSFDLVKPAWEAVKRNWQAFAVVNVLSILGALIAIFAPNESADFSSEATQINTTEQFSESLSNVTSLPSTTIFTVIGVGIIGIILLVVVAVILQAMATKLQLAAAEGKQSSLGVLWQAGKKYAFRIALLGLTAGLIVAFGLILLIVPGIIAIGRLSLAPYHMIDKDLGVMEALRASNEQAKQVGIGKIWGPIGVIILLSIGGEILGVIPVFGALLTVGVTIVASMLLPLRYRQLQAAPQQVASPDAAAARQTQQVPPTPPQPPTT